MNYTTNNDSDLSPEVMERITMLCNHPSLANYSRDHRGRRGAIYIPAVQQQVQNAIYSFSEGSLVMNDMRRNSFSG